jgi:CBS domain-containing protein
MKIKDVMNTRRVVSLKPEDDIAFAARLMSWAGVRHLPVLRGGEVVGVFSQRDYLRCREEAEEARRSAARGNGHERDHNGGDGDGLDGGAYEVRRFMSSPAITVSPEEPAVAASALLLARRIGCLPVVEDGALVGIVTASDLLGAEVRAAAPSVEAHIPVARAMTRDPVAVRAYQPLLEAVALMAERGFRHVPVVDAEHRLVGMISDRDVRTAIGDPSEALQLELTELEEMKVSSVMSIPGERVRGDAPLSDVAHRLAHGTVGAYPVVDAQDRLIGLVSYVDVIRVLLDLLSEQHAQALP